MFGFIYPIVDAFPCWGYFKHLQTANLTDEDIVSPAKHSLQFHASRHTISNR